MTFARIGVVSAIPAAGVVPGSGAAVDSLRVELGNVLEITGSNAAAACTLTLLRWFPPAPVPAPLDYPGRHLNALGEWRPWREDAPILVASMSLFSGRYEIAHDTSTDWLLLEAHPGDPPSVLADAQGAYYRQMT